jgi:hypothetical protein
MGHLIIRFGSAIRREIQGQLLPSHPPTSNSAQIVNYCLLSIPLCNIGTHKLFKAYGVVVIQYFVHLLESSIGLQGS